MASPRHPYPSASIPGTCLCKRVLAVAALTAVLGIAAYNTSSKARKLVKMRVGCLMDWMEFCYRVYLRHRRPKRIILVRHAESEGNVDKCRYRDVPDHALGITERGERQAHAAGVKLRTILDGESVFFIVSPYKRANLTYQVVKDTIDPKVWDMKEDPRLRELDFGNFQDPEDMEQTLKARNSFGRFWYRFKDGESGADVYDRATAFWESLFRLMDNPAIPQRYDNLVIVTHGLMMRLLLMRYYQWSVDHFHSIYNPWNCELWVMEKREEDGRYVLVTDINEHPQDHLRCIPLDRSFTAQPTDSPPLSPRHRLPDRRQLPEAGQHQGLSVDLPKKKTIEDPDMTCACLSRFQSS